MLGGSLQQCSHCSAQQWRYHSCRNRHCPRCQHRAQDVWRRARLAELVDVPYAHLVFTLPHALNALAGFHPRFIYDTLFASVAATLTEFAANDRWLGGQSGFTLVLHTWTQDLRTHLHVHALVPCGALGEAGQWLTPTRGERFLFPVHALSKVFRGKFMAALTKAEKSGGLPKDPQASVSQRAARRARLLRHDWVVYAKTALRGAGEVLDYLARYTYRVAVSDERILAIRGDDVLLRVRADDTGGKRCVRIDGQTFIERFLTHVLPQGYKRIRHYGWLGPAHKRERLARARRALAMPAPNPIAIEQAAEFMASALPKSISIAAGTVTSAAGASCRHCIPHSAGGQRRPSPPPVPHPNAMPRPTLAIPIPSRSAPVPRWAPYGCFTVSCPKPSRCALRRPAHRRRSPQIAPPLPCRTPSDSGLSLCAHGRPPFNPLIPTLVRRFSPTRFI